MGGAPCRSRAWTRKRKPAGGLLDTEGVVGWVGWVGGWVVVRWGRGEGVGLLLGSPDLRG